jgi:hypothetical protein
MSQSIAIHHHRLSGREWGRRHQLLLGALLGLVIGALGVAIVATTADVVRAALANETAASDAVAAYPVRELPREWRWERKAVEFDHMYRQKQSPRVDWIREGGKR